MKKGDCFTTKTYTKDGVIFSIERLDVDWPDYEEVEKLIISLAEIQGVKAVFNTYQKKGKRYRAWWFLDEDRVEPEDQGHDDMGALFALNWEPDSTTVFGTLFRGVYQ